jgi:hypothetical protein
VLLAHFVGYSGSLLTFLVTSLPHPSTALGPTGATEFSASHTAFDSSMQSRYATVASASRKSFFCLFEYGGNIFRRHRSGMVTQCFQLPTQMMRTNASFHADQARRHIG